MVFCHLLPSTYRLAGPEFEILSLLDGWHLLPPNSGPVRTCSHIIVKKVDFCQKICWRKFLFWFDLQWLSQFFHISFFLNLPTVDSCPQNFTNVVKLLYYISVDQWIRNQSEPHQISFIKVSISTHSRVLYMFRLITFNLVHVIVGGYALDNRYLVSFN